MHLVVFALPVNMLLNNKGSDRLVEVFYFAARRMYVTS